jgi:arsenite-transporting ATPase
MRLLSAPDLTRWYTRHLLGLSRGLARTILPMIRNKIKFPISEDMIQSRLGDLFAQVEELRGILTDRERTSVRLVLNPDHMSVQETQRAYTYMSLFGLSIDALFVNRVLPQDVRDPFFDRWKTSQAEHLGRVRALFDPLPVYEVPLHQQEVLGVDALQSLSQQLYGDRDPLPALSDEQPLEFRMEGDRYILTLRVAGVTSTNVVLEKRGDELYVQLGTFRRSLALPQYLAGLQPAWAQIEGDYLKIVFEEPPDTQPEG